jgi:hypothetical protein
VAFVPIQTKVGFALMVPTSIILLKIGSEKHLGNSMILPGGSSVDGEDRPEDDQYQTGSRLSAHAELPRVGELDHAC